MLGFLARGCDRWLTRYMARHGRRPPDYRPPEAAIPESPEAVSWPGPVRLDLTRQIKGDLWEFQAPSPVESPWSESRSIRGQVFGPAGSRSLLVVLHGAYGEYLPCQMLGGPFARQGFRVLVPAAPCHLERSPQGITSGAAFFWNAESVVLGLAQWLAEVRGMIQAMREEGVQRVGIIGYSIGSLAAGLAATLWPELDFVALLAPVGHHLEAIQRGGPAALLWPWMTKVSAGQSALLDRWAAVGRRPVVSRLLFLVPLFDVLQPTELQQAWWEAWDRPERRQYRQGHISVCFSPRLYRDLRQYATEVAQVFDLPGSGAGFQPAK